MINKYILVNVHAGNAKLLKPRKIKHASMCPSRVRTVPVEKRCYEKPFALQRSLVKIKYKQKYKG